MNSDKLFIPYDIADSILAFLDVKSTRNFLISSSHIYYGFHGSRHFQICMSKKICQHFNSLSKLKIDYPNLSNIELKKLYSTLNKIYNHFKSHPHTMLSDFLIYLCEFQEAHLFEIIISHCYFSKTGEYIYNALRADDMSYLLMFYSDLSVITKYIFVEPVIILNVIKFKILNKNTKDINLLLNYLLFKHFFRYSSYIDDILTEIVCEVIKSNNYENIQILKMLYHKRQFYRFRLNYQKILNASMQQKYEDIIVLIHENMIDNIRPILISKDYIRILMKNKYYKVLEKVIELYLGESINLKVYVDEIYYNFDNSNQECKNILKFLSIKNKNRFKIAKK